jgi:hypothetical protein
MRPGGRASLLPFPMELLHLLVFRFVAEAQGKWLARPDVPVPRSPSCPQRQSAVAVIG